MKWIALLLLVTMIWGSTFSLVKENLKVFGTFAQLAMRFLLAAIVLFAIVKWGRRKIGAQDVKSGAILGFLLFLGYAPQTFGLNYTSATNSAFITGLFVILVPILSIFFFAKAPERKIWVASLLAVCGLFLLTGTSGNWNIGDAMTLLTALGFALHIIYTGKIAGKCDPYVVLAVQFLASGILSFAFMLALGQVPAEYPIGAVGIVVFLAVFATAFAQWVQIEAQKFISAPRIALIFIGEPVFAMLTAVVFFGEGVGAVQMAGAGLILLGMFIAEYEKIRL